MGRENGQSGCRNAGLQIFRQDFGGFLHVGSLLRLGQHIGGVIDQHGFGIGPQIGVRNSFCQEYFAPWSLQHRGPAGGGVDLFPLFEIDSWRQIPLLSRSEAGALHRILNHLEEPLIKSKTESDRHQEGDDDPHDHFAEIIQMFEKGFFLVFQQEIALP